MVGSPFLIAIPDFIPLSRYVIKHSSPGDIPPWTINTLSDVIEGRKQCASHFNQVAQNSSNQSLSQHNLGHGHFIEVLEHILGLFNPDISNANAIANVISEPSASTGDHQEEQSPEPEDLPVQTQSTPECCLLDKPEWGPLLDDDDEGDFDYYMIIYSFFEEFNAVREHIRDLWSEYTETQSGSLINLAVLTNAAYEMFHQMESELKETLKGSHPEMTQYIHMVRTLCFDQGFEHLSGEGDENPGRKSDKADRTGIYAYQALGIIISREVPCK